jgi:hypothetical protein
VGHHLRHDSLDLVIVNTIIIIIIAAAAAAAAASVALGLGRAPRAPAAAGVAHCSHCRYHSAAPSHRTASGAHLRIGWRLEGGGRGDAREVSDARCDLLLCCVVCGARLRCDVWMGSGGSGGAREQRRPTGTWAVHGIGKPPAPPIFILQDAPPTISVSQISDNDDHDGADDEV